MLFVLSCIQTPTGKHTSKGATQMARKMVKTESRARKLEGEIEKVKDETIVTGQEAAKKESLAIYHNSH